MKRTLQWNTFPITNDTCRDSEWQETTQHDHPWRPKELFVEPVDGATLHIIAKLDGAVLYWKIIAACGWLCALSSAALRWINN